MMWRRGKSNANESGGGMVQESTPPPPPTASPSANGGEGHMDQHLGSADSHMPPPAVAESVLVEGEPATPQAEYVMADHIMAAVAAAQYGRVDEIVSLIENRHISAGDKDSEGCTLLQWASINNRYLVIRELLARGANINATGGILGETALQWAVRQGAQEAVVELVLRGGADVHVVGSEGLTALHLACIFKHAEIVLFLAASNPSLLDATSSNGQTALMALINGWNKGPAHHVKKYMDILRSLIAFGASVSLTEKSTGNTPLHMAVQIKSEGHNHRGGDQVIGELLEAGANVNATNADGDTPYKLAVKIGNLDAVKVLRQHGCESTLPSFLGFWLPWCQVSLGPILTGMFGWIYGCGSFWLACCGLNALTMQTQPMQRNLQHGMSACSIFIIVASMYLYMWNTLTTLFICWYLLSVGTLVYFFVKTTISDPGTITLDHGEPSGTSHGFGSNGSLNGDKKDDDSLALLEDSPVGRGSRHQRLVAMAGSGTLHASLVCSTCLLERPARSKHCPICRKCVDRFDHHCPFVNTCVGRHNIGYFIGFCTFCVIAIGSHLSVALPYVWHQCDRNEWERGGTSVQMACVMLQTEPPLTIITILALVHFIWIFMLLISQIQQLWSDMTTYEMIRRTPPLLPTRGFSHGVQNIIAICRGLPTAGEKMYPNGKPNTMMASSTI